MKVVQMHSWNHSPNLLRELCRPSPRILQNLCKFLDAPAHVLHKCFWTCRDCPAHKSCTYFQAHGMFSESASGKATSCPVRTRSHSSQSGACLRSSPNLFIYVRIKMETSSSVQCLSLLCTSEEHVIRTGYLGLKLLFEQQSDRDIWIESESLCVEDAPV